MRLREAKRPARLVLANGEEIAPLAPDVLMGGPECPEKADIGAAVFEGEPDIRAGRVHTLEEVMAELDKLLERRRSA